VSEKEHEFLDRIGQILEEDPDPQINALDVDRIYKACLRWRKLATDAAKYVESVICLRSNRFTGNQPYVGWKGLGLALREDYDELECAKAERDEADRRAGAAERELAELKEELLTYKDLRSQRKRDAGYDDGTSFDVVWAEALAALKEKRDRK